MSPRPRWVDVLCLLVLAAVVGALLAWATGQGSDGRSLLSHVRNAIGSLSTPWVLLPFVAGSMARRIPAGALLGVATTMAALTGWYLCAAALEDLGGHGALGDLRLEFAANRVYFVAGLISGPVMGAVGGWWRRTRTVSPIVVAGALLMGEAAALTVLTGLHGVGLLRFGSRLPSVLGVIANTSIVDSVSAAVVAGEFALGLAVVVLALRHRGARTP